MNKEYFSKLPNNLLIPIRDKETREISEKSIYNSTKDDKVILILDYLYNNTTRKGETLFSINDIVTTYGYKVDGHKGKINDKIKEVLFKLQMLDIIETDCTLFNIKNNELLKCKLNVDYESDFILLHRYELDLIMECIDLDKLVLLKLYCYLKARMYKRIDGRDIIATGGKAQVCYPSYRLISEEINIGYSTISKYIDKLKDIKLIDYINPGMYYHKSNPEVKNESPNTYVLHSENGSHLDELKEGVKFFKQGKEENGYMFVVDNPNSRKLNGELGGLVRLANKGKATDSQLARIEEIRNIIKINNKNS